MHTVVLGSNHQILATLREAGAPVVVVGAGRYPRLTEGPERNQCQVPVDDHTSIESVLLALRRLPDHVRLGSVYTQDEYAVVTAAAVAKALGVPGIDPVVAANFRDKTRQKSILRAGGLPTADFRELEGDPGEVLASCAELGYPLVIKPVAGAGTVDTELVTTPAEAETVVSRLRESRPGLRIMAESFVRGRERTIDGIVIDGRIAFFGVERYLHNLLGRGTRGTGAVVEDPERSPELYARAAEFAGRALSLLGMWRGSFHMEVFDDRGDFTFGECAARLGGMYLPLAYRTKFGVDLPGEAIRLHLAGDAPCDAPPVRRSPGGVGWSALACPAGKVESVPSVAEMLSLPGVTDCGIYVRPGDQATDIRESSTERAGQILVEGPDEATVERWLGEATRYFTAACRVA